MKARTRRAPSRRSCNRACSAPSSAAATAGAGWPARVMTAGCSRNGCGASIRTKRSTERALLGRRLGALDHPLRRPIDALQQLLNLLAAHELHLDPLLFGLLQKFR